MMRCDECRHWDDKDTLERVKGYAIRKCRKMPMFWDSTEWNDDCDRVFKPECADQKAFVQDGSDYSAIFLTRGDFFCAHFSNKE